MNYLRDWSFNKQFKRCQSRFKIHKTFDTKSFDIELETLGCRVYDANRSQFFNGYIANDNAIGVMATDLYDIGGHTPCFINFVHSFYKDYELHCFLTKKKRTCRKIIHSINDFVKIKGINQHPFTAVRDIIKLYNMIISSNISVLFLYIHMDDHIATATLSLIKKYTRIKIIFFNHGDHVPTMAMKFADLVLDARPSGQTITKTKRGYQNSVLIPLQSKKASDTNYYSCYEIKKKRIELGIKPNEYFTLSGFDKYKIFDNKQSPYLEMIKELLIQEKKLKHILMVDIDDADLKCIKYIFNCEPDAYSRLKIIPRTSDFEIIFQSCDLFIDSFPIGSALTHVDMMRSKRPTVIKINMQNPVQSFEYYLPKNYLYAFESINKMKEGILELLYDKDKQDAISEKLYQHYLETFEFEVVKLKYKKIIENIKKYDYIEIA